MLTRIRWAISSCALASLISGCGGDGDNLPRQAISGTVSYAGEPLKGGQISFYPADPGMKDPVTGGAPIQDGKYSIPQDIGLVPGKYNVSITSASSVIASESEAPGSTKSMPKELLPAKYNTKSSLNAEVKSGSNTIDFALDK